MICHCFLVVSYSSTFGHIVLVLVPEQFSLEYLASTIGCDKLDPVSIYNLFLKDSLK